MRKLRGGRSFPCWRVEPSDAGCGRLLGAARRIFPRLGRTRQPLHRWLDRSNALTIDLVSGGASTSALIPLSDNIELRHELPGRLTTLPVGEWLPRERAQVEDSHPSSVQLRLTRLERGDDSDRTTNEGRCIKTGPLSLMLQIPLALQPRELAEVPPSRLFIDRAQPQPPPGLELRDASNAAVQFFGIKVKTARRRGRIVASGQRQRRGNADHATK